MRKDFRYPSAGKGEICAYCWSPEGEVRAVVQIVHGIAEHALRYDHFARYLNSLGILVVAEDHMGHGGSAAHGSVHGYFHGGWFAAAEDTVKLLTMTQERHPDVPYILLGHSMGSFLARTILCKYPSLRLAGCILSGTAWQPSAILRAGGAVSKLICALTDEKKPGKLTQKLMFGSYNDRIPSPRTPSDWLSRDETVVDAYEADPMCGFTASYGLHRDMLQGIAFIQKEENLLAMNRKLPVFIVSGDADPVGGYGVGVEQVGEAFRKAGMEHVEVRLYPGCRHEILNELGNAAIYEDLAAWIGKLTP